MVRSRSRCCSPRRKQVIAATERSMESERRDCAAAVGFAVGQPELGCRDGRRDNVAHAPESLKLTPSQDRKYNQRIRQPVLTTLPGLRRGSHGVASRRAGLR